MHITLACQCVVEGEGSRQVVVCLSTLSNLEIIPEKLLVVGVSTVLDDTLCTLHRTLSAQVSDTLFCDDNVHIMLSVVMMAHHGHDRTDGTTLGYRGTGENADIGIALEIATTTDTVHHFCSTDVCRVAVAIDITLQCGVDSNHTESADKFGRVGYLTLTECEVLLEIVDIVLRLHQTLVGHGE